MYVRCGQVFEQFVVATAVRHMGNGWGRAAKGRDNHSPEIVCTETYFEV